MGIQQAGIAALEAAIAKDPGNTGLRLLLGEMLLEQGNLDDAAAVFKQALGLDPGNLGIKLGLARCLKQQGSTEAAINLLESICLTDEPTADAYLLLAKLRLDRSEVDRAVEAYNRAIDLSPELNDPFLERRLGIGEKTTGESDVVDGKVRLLSSPPASSGDPARDEPPSVTFRDVGGMQELKEDIRLKIIYPIKDPEVFKAYGKATGGGILMYGPPGCGKTHLARATAGEVQASFLSIGINDVLDMWIGSSERNLHDLFEHARTHAPCVLFFDEVDALAASRSDMRTNAGRHIINQFLAELDGIDNSNEGVLVLAATNAPWHLDNAFRRPGRFDRTIFVPPPDLLARDAILRILLRGKPADEVDFEAIAKRTQEFSGADLKAVVDFALDLKIKEAMKRGGIIPITTKELLKAAKKTKPTTKEWFATARNHVLFANKSGLYDPVKEYLKL